MARRFYANFAPTLTLSGAINAAVTSFSVATNFAGYPASAPYYVVIEYGSANAEIVLVTTVVGSTATVVTRGQDGTTAVSHAAGASVDFCFVKADLDEANAHVNASAAVHGLAGTVVGTSDTQSLTNKSFADNLSIGGNLTVTGTSLHTAAATFSGTVHVVGSTTIDGGLIVTNGAEVDSGNFLVNGVGANVTVNHNVVAGNAVLAPGIRTQARYANGQSCPSGTTVLGSVAAPAVAEFDTLGFVTTTGVATVPTTGTYEISAQIMLSSNVGWTSAGIYKNGSLLTSMPVFVTSTATAAAPPMEFSLTAGDTIDIRVVTSSTLTTLSSLTAKSFLLIKRLS